MVFQVSKAAIALILSCMILTCAADARTQNYSFHSDEPRKYLNAIKGAELAATPACFSDKAIFRAGIVTHHLLAIGLMNEFFFCLSKNAKPERVVLIGPDHYGQSIERISVSSLPWKTPFGTLASDTLAATTINSSLNLDDDPEAFSGEHSIGVLVPFIHYYFPESRLVPIIIQRNVGLDKLNKFKTILNAYLSDPKTLVLLSMDFTHNQTSEEADRRDELSRNVIEKFEYEKTDKLDVDCHPGLKMLLAALRERQGMRARFLNHSNSAKITGQTGLTNVTSYFTILFEEHRAISYYREK
jgi:AmmeMemoRadiSam system protein B